MTIHRPHPLNEEWNGKKYDDPENVVLYDDCERCDQHANAIVTIDRQNLAKLWDEMVLVEYDSGERDYYRTINEAKACSFLYRLSIINHTLFSLSARHLQAIHGVVHDVDAGT